MLRTLQRFCVFVLFILCFESDGLPQSPELRYQLGRRLTRFERKWQTADAASRAQSTPKMMAAVDNFFSLQLDAAIVKLDEAWLTVDSGGKDPTAASIFDASWFVQVRPLLLDRDNLSLGLTLKHQQLAAKLPLSSSNCDLSVTVVDSQGTQVVEKRWESVSNDDAWDWGLKSLTPGDYQVMARLVRGDLETDVIGNRFSVISNLGERMNTVRTLAMGRRPAPTDTKSLSIQSLSKMIVSGHDGRISETDLPFATLLNDLDFLSAEDKTVRELIQLRPERSIWLQLGNGESKQHVRLQSASNQVGSPLVVAFHGAGGSENMFFESYGAGGLIDLCRQKGWSVVSPRQSLMGLGMDLDSMLDELRLHMDFDANRVFVIGHSMGAAQAISQVSKYPTRVRAVAAIGGGGRPVKSNELPAVPFFVAAGEKDFGLPRAKVLADTLKSFGARVDFLEVKEVEHMVVVQATLADTIAFFDEHK